MASAYERRVKQVIGKFICQKGFLPIPFCWNKLYDDELNLVGRPDMVLWDHDLVGQDPVNPSLVVEIERPKTWAKGLIQVWHYSKFAERAVFVTSLSYLQPIDLKRLKAFCIDHKISLIDVSNGLCEVVLNYID